MAGRAEVSTPGEQLAGRRLRKEKRAGVDHFVSGQHRAERTSERGVYALSYVDAGGHAVLLVVLRLEQLDDEMSDAIEAETRRRAQEGWVPVLATRAGQGSVQGTRPVRPDFQLSDKMLGALTAAMLRPEET